MTHLSYLRGVAAGISLEETRKERLQALHDEGLSHRARIQEMLARVNNEMTDSGHGMVESLSRSEEQTFPSTLRYPNYHLGTLYHALWAMVSNVNVSIAELEAKTGQSFDPHSPIVGNALVVTTVSSDGFCDIRPKHEHDALWNALKS